VEKILDDLDLGRIPRQIVFNKMDLVPSPQVDALCRRFDAIAVSARDRKTFAPLLNMLEERFWPREMEGSD
jgi:GTP-binding protein HflX